MSNIKAEPEEVFVEEFNIKNEPVFEEGADGMQAPYSAK